MPSLIARLKSSRVLQSPRVQDKDWFNNEFRALEPGDIGTDGASSRRPRAAALAIVLREVVCGGGNASGNRVEMLLIKRAVNPRDTWSGHVALPGGRQEARESKLQAAVRECEEEVGIRLLASQFALLGRLKDTKTSKSKSALSVSCFVFAQTDSSELPVTIQPSEVAHAWWVDTAIFYPNAVPSEIGFALTKMLKASRKLYWKALMRLLGAETVYMPCFFLPPPPYLSQNTNASQMSTPPNSSAAAPSEVVPPEPGVSTIPRYATAASGIATDDPHDARSFVLWGLTYGVVSNLVVAGGGEGFALKGPPYFRFRSTGTDFVISAYYKLQTWAEAFGQALGSTLNSNSLRLRR